MNIIRKAIQILISLRTSLWLLGIMLLLMFAGAFVMPGNDAFQALHYIPMFDWIGEQQPEVTWWLWGLIGVLVLLTVNTLFCSIDSIIKKRNVTQWLLLISPQIIHIGFLFMLLAHLFSAAGASQAVQAVGEGSVVKLLDNKLIMKVEKITVYYDYYGNLSDWKVDLDFSSDGSPYTRDVIRPNNPSVQMGFNINLKDLRVYPQKAVLLQINREPGAYWALAGGILFMVGIVILVILRIKMEK